ncbi:non-specific lipid-transfer protein 2 [Cinnamomum micranthum f. kanehirae]|uniref:Non-specific lipid-transfer protein 2 n=1 Tax=Cinnamomum micranthum f. kanehirae TaxID=337451 RepID=A0A3S3MYP9_9MAGN|nr:non-specific lipid-transfer protein 2 [Cinnamomum micranthum f. kanehirae]RWR82077.1 non-specific lipid-transfer protein 2 [Cinnamomum micranthum f. kanehirae]
MKASYFVVGLMVVLLICNLPASESVTCQPTELSPCAPAIIGGSAPTPLCCTKLNEQKPCLCQYMKDPNLRKYIDSPNAKKVAQICKIPFPKC